MTITKRCVTCNRELPKSKGRGRPRTTCDDYCAGLRDYDRDEGRRKHKTAGRIDPDCIPAPGDPTAWEHLLSAYWDETQQQVSGFQVIQLRRDGNHTPVD